MTAIQLTASASMAWHRWQDGALLLEIAVQPGASASSVAGLHGGRLKVRIQAPPVDGKANRALIKFLAGEFATPRSRIEIVRGDSGRAKTVRIDRPVTLPSALMELGLAPRA